MITILLHCLRKLLPLEYCNNIPDVPPLFVSYPCSAHLHPVLHSIVQNDFVMLALLCDFLVYNPSQSLSVQNPNGIVYSKDENVPTSHSLVWEESKFNDWEGWR